MAPRSASARILTMVQVGPAGRPVERDCWWTSFDIDAAHTWAKQASWPFLSWGHLEVRAGEDGAAGPGRHRRHASVAGGAGPGTRAAGLGPRSDHTGRAVPAQRADAPRVRAVQSSACCGCRTGALEARSRRRRTGDAAAVGPPRHSGEAALHPSEALPPLFVPLSCGGSGVTGRGVGGYRDHDGAVAGS